MARKVKIIARNFIRKEDWLERLYAYFNEVQDTPFTWGKHDCCHFAGHCIEAMTGKNPMRGIRYRSKIGAYRLMKETPLKRRLAVLFGKAIPLAMAKRGDIIYTTFDRCPTIGICIGHEAVFVGAEGAKEGLITIPVCDCEIAFQIEF